MKKLIYAVLTAAIALTGCGGRKEVKTLPGDLYPAEYVTLESVPYNVQVNRRAVTEVIDSQADYRTIRLSYPDYGATGVIVAVMVDSARLMPTLERYVYMLEAQGDTIVEAEQRSSDGIHGWLFVHPAGEEQIQWLATDSMSMYVGGRLHFEAARDSTVDISAALDNVRTDIRHLINNVNK